MAFSGLDIISWNQAWSHRREAYPLAAWSFLKHLLYNQTETQNNRKSSSDMWAFGPVARAFLPSKINEAQKCQLFQLPTIISSQQPASLILLHFNAQEESQLEKARKTWSKHFYEERLKNPSRTFHKQYYKISFLFISRVGEKSRGKGK